MVNCDKIWLTNSNELQAFSFFVVLDLHHIIQYCSSNVLSFFDVHDHQALIHKAFPSLFSPKNSKRIQAWLEKPQKPNYQPLIQDHNKTYWFRKQKVDEFIIIEFEPELSHVCIQNGQDIFEEFKYSSQRVFHQISLAQITSHLVEWLYTHLMFDAVRVYQFNDDQSGTVIAEKKSAHLPSFYLFRFPAYEVPRPVRNYFKSNPYRYIPDIDLDRVYILPESSNVCPFLLQSIAKEVVPVHIKYLRNMQVQSAFSLPILIDNKLWGIVACQSKQAKYLHPQDRNHCVNLMDYVSLQLNLLFKTQEADKRQYRFDLYIKLKNQLDTRRSLFETLNRAKMDLISEMEACGYAIVIEDKFHLRGNVPDITQLRPLIFWINRQIKDELFFTTNLPGNYKPAEHFKHNIYGMLALQLGKSSSSYLIFFREEHRATIEWAGDPNAFEQDSNETKTYSPRNSFDKWVETISGKSKDWTRDDFAYADMVMRLINDKWLQQSLSEKVYIDSLTHTYNRHYLDELCKQDQHERLNEKRDFCLAMIDVDNFKLLNDRYGHPFGDLVLKQIANIICAQLRSKDIVCRYGGEEFLTILYGCNAENGLQIMNKLLESVRHYSFKTESDETVKVTMSIGLAYANEEKGVIYSLIERADKALYQAKHTGKDKVLLFNSETS